MCVNPAHSREIDNFWFQSARGLFPSFAVIGLTTFGVTISKTTKSQWKTITRLSQVRVRHLKDDRVDQFIRMRHGLHGISLGLFPEYRDVKLENIKLKSLGQHRGESISSLFCIRVRTHLQSGW